MTSRNPHLFIFGLGYSANALAERLIQEGFRISATCRNTEKQAVLQSRGIETYLFDRDRPLDQAGLAALKTCSHLLSSIPPGDTGDPVILHHKEDLLAAAPFDWIGYLSTTGVYGDRKGGWVDETSSLDPTGERGERRVRAERAWFELCKAGPVHSFRLAGIYGPGRNALETVRKGRARRVVKPDQVFSRIHLDDITAILHASLGRPNNGAAYNCCDDEAAPPQDVIEFACHLLGTPVPPDIPYETAELSPMARSFYRDNKRVSNKRIKEELGVTLTWPDYRQALTSLHRNFQDIMPV